MSSLFDLSGKTAVVTGSTKGIGRAIAERFAEHGAKVVIASRKIDECKAVVAELEDRYGKGIAIARAFDLADRDTIEAPVQAALDAWGRIDILVGNAASIHVDSHRSAKDKHYDLTFQYNLRNNAALATAAIPAMQKQGGGSIMFIASTVGVFPSPPYLTYGMAKAAMIHMTKIMAVDYGRENIRVNTIAPGFILTPANGALEHDPERTAKVLGNQPLGRIGKPDEIAGAAVFLASPAGAYMTGQVMVVDGGQVHAGREAARLMAEERS